MSDDLPAYLQLHQAANEARDERLVVPLRSCTFVGVHGRVKLVAGEKCIVPSAELRGELRAARIIREQP